MEDRLKAALKMLKEHHEAFYSVVDLARETQHPVPMDTRGWSQILVSVLTGIPGLARKKGADLADGSDVKAANTWEAIDTPRFNGAIKAGTLAETADSIASLDAQPYLFLVLWDHTSTGFARCRIWCVRTQVDMVFRSMCEQWYEQRRIGIIRSTNFQLHPPRGRDENIIKNKCGNLEYPLLFAVVMNINNEYEVTTCNPNVLTSGQCRAIPLSVASKG